MLSFNKLELDKIMKRFQNDAEGAEEKKRKEKEAQDDYVREFEKLKHEIIWPVIVDVGNQLTEYGHDFHVSEDVEYIDATANYRPASITFNIYPAGLPKHFHKPDSTPYISFVSNKYAKNIGIVVSTMMPNKGGVVGYHGEYNPDKITKDLVEKEIITVLKNSLILN